MPTSRPKHDSELDYTKAVEWLIGSNAGFLLARQVFERTLRFERETSKALFQGAGEAIFWDAGIDVCRAVSLLRQAASIKAAHAVINIQRAILIRSGFRLT